MLAFLSSSLLTSSTCARYVHACVCVSFFFSLSPSPDLWFTRLNWSFALLATSVDLVLFLLHISRIMFITHYTFFHEKGKKKSIASQKSLFVSEAISQLPCYFVQWENSNSPLSLQTRIVFPSLTFVQACIRYRW